jgi:HAD superfamily hydrolase (TIGR01458 family)
MKPIKGLLIDLDGVIYNDSRIIEGAVEIIEWLQQQKIPFRFITNTTMKNRDTICKKLAGMGINVEKSAIFSAVYAASIFVRQNKNATCHFLLTDDAKAEFPVTSSDTGSADYVVVGDLGKEVTFEKLNLAFQKLLDGAELIALQKNRFWLSDDGFTLDTGAFVALLEFASNKTATVIGKPSRLFFEMALKDLKLSPAEVLMIGDDVESDIVGASNVNIQTCLVQTGKFREMDLKNSAIKPDHILPSIKYLKDLLKS